MSRYPDPSLAPDDATEKQVYLDAWRIASAGAVNPAAVASTLADASSALVHRLGTQGVREHPALRVIAAQLAMLFHVEWSGLDSGAEYDAVKAYTDRMKQAQAACPDQDQDCLSQGCPEHPAHNSGDHTYEQHHIPGDHAGPGPCRCSAYQVGS